MRITKEDFTSLLERILRFKDNFAALLVIYLPRIAIVGGIVILLQACCKWLALPYRYTSPILKLLICVLPVFPTLSVWRCRDDFGGESGLTDGIMDACFAIWFLIILFAWIVI